MMKFTQGQEAVLQAVFKEFSAGNGVLANGQLLDAIRQVTNTRVIGAQFTDAVGSSPTDVGDVDYDNFVAVLSKYLNDMRVSHWGKLITPMEGRVGIDALPTQVRKRVLKNSIQFNIMLVGCSGLGKSTLQNTLFKSQLNTADHRTMPTTVEINSTTHCIQERGTRVVLTVVDTPGFGDQIDNTDAWRPVVDYIKKQYCAYLAEELKPNRKRYIPDTRVHVVLYFITPTGHSLKALDISAMKALGKIANVVPIIAKADTLVLEEREAFKHRIMEELAASRVRVFPFSLVDDEEDDRVLVAAWRSKMPFAVVGCDDFSEGQLVRRTAWGNIQVENPEHCDLSLLRNLLIRNHLSDLIRMTDKYFYESFRTCSITGEPEQESDSEPQSPETMPKKNDVGQMEEEENGDEDGSYEEE